MHVSAKPLNACARERTRQIRLSHKKQISAKYDNPFMRTWLTCMNSAASLWPCDNKAEQPAPSLHFYVKNLLPRSERDKTRVKRSSLTPRTLLFLSLSLCIMVNIFYIITFSVALISLQSAAISFSVDYTQRSTLVENAVKTTADADLLIRTPPSPPLDSRHLPAAHIIRIHLSAIFTPTNSDPCVHTRK